MATFESVGASHSEVGLGIPLLDVVRASLSLVLAGPGSLWGCDPDTSGLTLSRSDGRGRTRQSSPSHRINQRHPHPFGLGEAIPDHSPWSTAPQSPYPCYPSVSISLLGSYTYCM